MEKILRRDEIEGKKFLNLTFYIAYWNVLTDRILPFFPYVYNFYEFMCSRLQNTE